MIRNIAFIFSFLSLFLFSCINNKECINYSKEVSTNLIKKTLPYNKSDTIYFANNIDTFKLIITDSLFRQILQQEGINQDCKGGYSYFTLNYYDLFASSEFPGIDSLKISILRTKYDDCFLQFYFNGSKSAKFDFIINDFIDSVNIEDDGYLDSMTIMNYDFKLVNFSIFSEDTIYYTLKEGIVCLALNSINQKFVLVKHNP